MSNYKEQHKIKDTKFFLLIQNPETSDYTNIIAPRNPKDSKTAFTVTTALQKKTLSKYFKKAKDLEIIKDSLLEEPQLYEFDQVHSSDSIDYFFENLIEKLQDDQETAKNIFSGGRKTDDLIVIFSTQRIHQTFFGHSSQFLRMLFESRFEITGIKATLMLEDLKSDLLTSDVFETLDGVETYREAKDIQGAFQLFETMNANLEKMKKKFKINFIHKLAHILISFKSKTSTTDFLFFPVFDRNLRQNTEKYKEWCSLKLLFGANTASISAPEDKEQDLCHEDFLEKKLKKSKTLTFILNVNSSPENFKDNLPVMEEITKFKMEIRESPHNNEDFTEYDNSDFENSNNIRPVSDYANKLVKDIEEFVFDTNEFIQETQVRDSLDKKKKQLGYFEHKITLAEKNNNSKLIRKTLAKCQKKLRGLRNNLENAYRNSEFRNSHSNLGLSGRKIRNSNFSGDRRSRVDRDNLRMMYDDMRSNANEGSPYYGKKVFSAQKRSHNPDREFYSQNNYGFGKQASHTGGWIPQPKNKNSFAYQNEKNRNPAVNREQDEPNYRSLKDELRDLKNVVASEFNKLKIKNETVNTSKPKENYKRGNRSNRRAREMLSELDDDEECSDLDDDSLSRSSYNVRKAFKRRKKYIKKYLKKTAPQPNILQHDTFIFHQLKKLKKENKRMKTSIKELKKLLVKKDAEIEEFKQNEIRMDIQINQYKESVDIIGGNNRELQMQAENFEDQIENLKGEIFEQNNLKEAKKKKWQDKKSEYEEIIDDLRTAVNELSSEKMVLESRLMEFEKCSEEDNDRSKVLGEELERMKQEIEEFQMQAIEIQEVSNQRNNKNMELSMRIEHMEAKNEELKDTVGEIEKENQALEQKFELMKLENNRERDDILADRDREIEFIKNENDDLRKNLTEEEMKVEELRSMVQNMKEKMHEIELELKDNNQSDMEIFKLREKNENLIGKIQNLESINKINDERIKTLDKENSIIKSEVERYEEQMETVVHSNDEKEQEILQLKDECDNLEIERDELIEKNAVMLKNLSNLESVQQEEWNRVEEKVESTLQELKSIRVDNENLNCRIEELTLRNEELEEKVTEFKTKYKAKKTENHVLKEKCLKLTHALAKLESDNQDIMQYLSLKERHDNKVQRKMRAIEDVKGMIGVYRGRVNKY